ncbi:MAG: T9SS C-terminal target domain-containing protein [Sporocytophaga sp.]|uniref:T9SS C-terminal target domain-containing protein n=1 Tax=Sporocytophaga sp. TaxID=2231183 RepID=UPI001B24FB1E|nr:T9SS C-terminal target domain-containing protein [Sporocytophaga sp.]MBO9700168.1 T9SS C-terminal target domain-containing protein [Sporocytophaga sp.]
MKRLSSIFLAALMAVNFACKKDKDDAKVTPSNEVTLEGTITQNMTLEAGKKYILRSNVYVAAPAELTIPAGTVIYGDKVTKGALIIDRGAKIHAVGTASNPIIFTSAAPSGYKNYGDWGGIVLLGKAPNNGGASVKIEGVSASTGDNGFHGGTDADDNSGEFQYVRVEFAGIALSPDNELNGVTFGSVGRSTKVDHVQVSFSGDDAFEWFGGTVNAKYLVAFRSWDDDFDTDNGFSGNVQYGIVVRDPSIADISLSNGFESDNDKDGSSNQPLTAAQFSNITVLGPYAFKVKSVAAKSGKIYNYTFGDISGSYGQGAHLRRNTAQAIYNSVIIGFPTAVNFEKTNSGSKFSGNFLSRYKTLAAITSFDTTGFTANNRILAGFNLSDYFAGVVNQKIDSTSNVANIFELSNINPLLKAGSPLLTGSSTVSAGLEQTSFVGAFDASNNWMQGWTNFDPKNIAY